MRKLISTIYTVAMMLAGCTNPIEGPENPNVDDLASKLDEAAQILGSASGAGKTVRSVKPFAQNGGGYSVAFTDGSSAMLHNGSGSNSGVTPFVAIDSDDYWCVSYDGDVTYERLVSADSKDGVNGTNVRVAVDNGGKYLFELYSPASPQTVKRTIKTEYSPSPASVLQSVVRDDNSQLITLTLADSRVFGFGLEAVYPTSVEILKEKVVMPANGQAKFEFAITPANAKFSPATEGSEANLRLSGSGSSAPANFKLVSVERSKSADGKIKAGHYTATVKDSGLSGEYSEKAALVLTTQNGSGKQVELRSAQTEFVVTAEPYLLSLKIGNIEAVQTDENVFHIKLPYGTDVKSLRPQFETNGARVELNGSAGFTTVNFSNPVTFTVVAASGRTKEYTVAVHYSNLPIVYITTPAPILSKEEWVTACGIQIWNAGSENGIYADVQMKGRGNLTWTYEKRPYAIKLNKKAEVLGMPKHKRWVLLANYLDHTCMRNAVAFEAARKFPGLEWTPRGRFVDVVLNGVMQGNYYLCEQIKVDENRVNITEITPEDIAGEAVTGGYLLELDTYYDELFKFRTALFDLPVQFKDPDENIPDAQFEYVRNYFNNIENIIQGKTSGNIFDQIDIDSFVDWFLVNNIALNYEAKHPKSFYMNKDRNGKMKAGPVWDFDYGTFVPSNDGLIITSAVWYNSLLGNKTFISRLKERWSAYKAELDSVEYFIDETAAEIRESAEANIRQWPNDGFDFINGDTTLSFDDAAARLKQVYKQRIATLDKIIRSL